MIDSTTPIVEVAEVPLERLEADLAGFAASIAAATCAWLLTLAAYDRRAGWESWSCKSCAAWLMWKCGMSPRTAREHVRVARALEGLPLITDAFSQGRLSYCKVRSLCRVANEDNEAELVDLGVAMTGSQLERTVAGLVRVERCQDEEAFDAVAARRLTIENNHDGTMAITLVVPADDAALVKHAIDKRVDTIIEDAAHTGQPRNEVIEHRGGIAAIKADATVELLTNDSDTGNESRPFDVTVVIDPTPTDLTPAVGPVTQRGSAEPPDTRNNTATHKAALDSVGPVTQRGSAEPPRCRIGAETIAPATALRLCCDALVTPAVEHITPAGAKSLIDIGRRSRTVPRRLRRALEQRDNHTCQFPGCDTTRRLHAHHIIWWRHDGPTDLDNLVLVCHYHHRVIHEGKWTVLSTSGGMVEFLDPHGHVAAGRQIPANPFQLTEPEAPHLESHWAGESLDYAMITGDCRHNEHINRQRRTTATFAG